MKPYFETKLGRLYWGNCLEIIPRLETVDLTVTSPPYDNLRDYKGYTFEFEGIAKKLYRITKNGGIVVWIVGDATIDGSETGTSFKQALHFKEIGFNLHDTMIYWKNAFVFPQNNRYAQNFEYMFVLSKNNPETHNIFKLPTNSENRIKAKSSCYRAKNGKTISMQYETGKDERNRENVWIYEVGYQKNTKDKIAFKHPATFPEALAQDHILSWSNEGDIVLDPMAGSGTVAKICERLNRHWIGIEISEKYCEIAAKRIESEASQLKLFR